MPYGDISPICIYGFYCRETRGKQNLFISSGHKAWNEGSFQSQGRLKIKVAAGKLVNRNYAMVVFLFLFGLQLKHAGRFHFQHQLITLIEHIPIPANDTQI